MDESAILEAAVQLKRAGRQLRRAGEALEAAVDSPPGDEPPPLPLLGAAAHRNGRPDREVFGEFQEAAGGNVACRVTYSKIPGPLWQNHPASADRSLGASWSWCSIKTLNRQEIMDFVRSIPPEERKTTIVTVWHEPEDNIAQGAFTLEAWTEAQQHLAVAADLFDAHSAAVLTAWTFKQPGWEKWETGVRAHPWLMGIDGYNGDVRTPQDVFRDAFDTATLWGRTPAIRECGTVTDPSYDWWSELWRYADTYGAAFVCPWDSDAKMNGAWTLSNDERAHLGFLSSS